MALYTVRYGETLLDVCYNTTGAITAIDAIMDANGFDTYTPELTPGQVLEVPDVVYNSDAVHVANVRPFNSACGIEDDDLHGMIDGATDDMGDIPGPPDDPNIDPVEPEPQKPTDKLSIVLRYQGKAVFFSLSAEHPVASALTVSMLVTHTDGGSETVQVTIPQGSDESAEKQISTSSTAPGDYPTQVAFSKIEPSFDDEYQYLMGNSVAVAPFKKINYLSIHYRLPEPKDYITIYTLADFAVTSDVKCTLAIYDTEQITLDKQVTVTIKKGFQSSSEVKISYAGENRIQFVINGVEPLKDDTYEYQAGQPIEIIP